MRSAGELDRLSRELKGSCSPFVLHLAFLQANASRWTPGRLAELPGPWLAYVGTEGTLLSKHHNTLEAEMPVSTFMALETTDRARIYPRASSRKYDALGFASDLGIIFGNKSDGGAGVLHKMFAFGGEERGSATIRLSARGARWAAHWDQFFNHLLQLHGEKAVTLFPFGEAANLYLDRNRSSPSYRHSLRDEARPLWYPRWCRARGSTVVLRPADVLYVPPFHVHATETLSAFSVSANRFAASPSFHEYGAFASGCRA